MEGVYGLRVSGSQGFKLSGLRIEGFKCLWVYLRSQVLGISRASHMP